MLCIIEKRHSERIPYRLRIQKADEILLCLHVQDRWPGRGGQIFCMRTEGEAYPGSPGTEVERVPVVSLRRYGKRLAVVLDRPRNKRCDFLFLKKRYKRKEGEYEQIFWRTQRALVERRPRVRLTARGDASLHVAVDINERYAWRFSGCWVTRESLPAGDYALKDERGIVAIVERKSMQNLLHDFGQMAILHQTLGELEAYSHAALVIEAGYADFLKPKKVAPYSPGFTAKALGELFALHPRLQIIFAGNRKLGNEWTSRFFGAVQSHDRELPHPAVREAVAAYGRPASFYGGTYYDAVRKIEEMPDVFTMAMLKESLASVPEETIKRALRDLKKAGRLISHRAGVRSYWEKT